MEKCASTTQWCSPSPSKNMFFNEPIFIILTVTQQIVVNMFSTGLYLDQRKNLEKYLIFPLPSELQYGFHCSDFD